jgi:DNA repair exonuclease SbcCD nuclease subunit
MKFIAISDQHLGSKLYNFTELENDCREMFSKAVDLAIELKVDYLVSVGDLFDNNKPTSEIIDFVSHELGRLRAAGIQPVALAGDHSKPLDGVTWEKVAGFRPINSVSAFVGFDYSDNPKDTLELVNRELASRPRDSVQFIFMHQQIPELWPFCEEKKKISLKDLDFSNHCGSLRAIFLGDIHKRREMNYLDPICNRKVFVGYCGSLGVTAGDETEKDGLYYWNETKLELIECPLPRKFVTLEVNEKNISSFSKDAFEIYRSESAKPVFLCKYASEVADSLDKLHFLYEYGMVKFTRVKKGADQVEEHINIRSELKTSDRISGVLKEMTTGKEAGDLLYRFAYRLVTEEDPARVLDDLKSEVYEKTQQTPAQI